MKLGLDLDGVILDHTEAKIAAGLKRGYRLMPEQTPSDILKTLMPSEAYRSLQAEVYNGDKAGVAPLMDGAREGLLRLGGYVSDMRLISRRINPAYAIAALTYHGLWPSLFNETNAHFVPTKEAKAEEAVRQELTHFLDDEIHMLELLTSVPTRILFDPYTVHHDAPFLVASSWDVFIALVR